MTSFDADSVYRALRSNIIEFRGWECPLELSRLKLYSSLIAQTSTSARQRMPSDRHASGSRSRCCNKDFNYLRYWLDVRRTLADCTRTYRS